tara:strand:- start:785 stop:892 length:108 start_codon:yes stop_codon:yes gene_type:complete
MSKPEVAIVGIGIHPFGELLNEPDKSKASTLFVKL